MADAGRSRRARTTADGGAGRCLSNLSDDLLRHILYLAPDRDGAATAVLSRRWRWLWRTSGAVYLDSRFFTGGCSSPDQEREAFLRGAEHALAAAATHGRIRRLRISIAEDSNMEGLTFRLDRSEDNLMETLISIPAARRVEELQIEVKSLKLWVLSFGSLPSEALRVLRITGCEPLTAVPPPTAFPMLVDLHLQDCGVSLVDLQSMIDASPRLSTLHLECFSLFKETNDQLVRRLRLPAVSTLVLTECTYEHLELDAPRLQCFRYTGYVEDTDRLSLKSQASANIVHVDLDFTRGDNKYIYDPTPSRELFWRFIQNFNTTKHLKLAIHNITMDDLALIDKASYDQLLGGLSFSLLEQLELEAEYKPQETSMAMLTNLLQCCPMLLDIRIKLTKQDENPSSIESSIIDKQAGLHFDKSVSSFRNRRRRPMVSSGRQNDDNYEALDIPGLNGEHSFNCLQSHLKRVSLQFFMDEPNCLGIQVAKFFAKNAMVLQEMHIDDGSHEMLEHLNSIFRTKMDC